MKDRGTLNINGHKLPLLCPPWVLAFGIEIARGAPEKPGDRARFVEWVRDNDRLEKLRSRLETQRKDKARTVIRIGR